MQVTYEAVLISQCQCHMSWEFVIQYSPGRFVPVQNVIDVRLTVVVSSPEEVEDQREEGEARPEDDGVAGVTELPGPV